MNVEEKKRYLSRPVEHIDITRFDARPLVEAMGRMAYSARDLARAADIYNRMLADSDCGIILCLAGSLISAGLKKVFVEMIRSNMVDAVVSTGANLVDQDFFEALGFRHYQAELMLKSGVHDDQLRRLHIDRIYDTLIDEDELRICDETVCQIADSLAPRSYSSREFLAAMGQYLAEGGAKCEESIVLEAYRQGVPLFCPAFSDCSAGFGLVMHRAARRGQPTVAIDSAKDFDELTQIKILCKETGLFMIGGGVPKNFAQDVVVAADVLGVEAPMHKYAIQITVADVRDGGLSGSTLVEASSWGKVDSGLEQMVYAEATLAVPLIASSAWHQGHWKRRTRRNFNAALDQLTPVEQTE
ncbi:MAG TPA: deoxyhypusine synthase [Thermoguttaceae bacterium]|nr:deoxyhypusine synthase [Thermoguttaceae bacterium]